VMMLPNYWYTQAVAVRVARQRALLDGVRQRVESCPKASNVFGCGWQIVPADVAAEPCS
jgi:hypothetical protein